MEHTEKGKEAMMKIWKPRWSNRRSRQKTGRILHRLLAAEMVLDPQTMHLRLVQETEAGREMRHMLQVLGKSRRQQALH